MIIDFHTHVFDFGELPGEETTPVTWENLIERLNEEGIDKAVVLPLGVNPESIPLQSLFKEQNDTLSQISPPDNVKNRVILFGNVDPRMGLRGNLTVNDFGENLGKTDFSWILEKFIKRGCVGIGEVTSYLAQDDPLVINLFEQCGDYNLPVLFHTTGRGRGVYGLFDEPGLPRLENLLKQVPNTICIGHATGIWAEIDGDITPTDKFIYPRGKIKKPGRLLKLLEKYNNFYVDTSGISGYNALTRDPDFGVKFINEYREKIIFGSDVCFADPQHRMPHLNFLRGLLEEGKIDEASFQQITYKNTLKVLKLYTP